MNAETRLEKRLGFLVNSDGTVHWPVENFGFLYAGASVDVQAKLWNELLRLERENEWIPVSERLPKQWELVLIATEVGPQRFVRADRHDKDWEKYAGCTVTHWRPLPQPPEREK